MTYTEYLEAKEFNICDAIIDYKIETDFVKFLVEYVKQLKSPRKS